MPSMTPPSKTLIAKQSHFAQNISIPASVVDVPRGFLLNFTVTPSLNSGLIASVSLFLFVSYLLHAPSYVFLSLPGTVAKEKFSRGIRGGAFHKWTTDVICVLNDPVYPKKTLKSRPITLNGSWLRYPCIVVVILNLGRSRKKVFLHQTARGGYSFENCWEVVLTRNVCGQWPSSKL